MTRIHVSVDSPAHYQQGVYFMEGANPELLDQFFNYIEGTVEEIEEINLAFYLFNNPVFWDKLVNLAERGIRVNVITIPLKGYDQEKPQDIVSYKGGSTLANLTNQTKFSLAKEVYEKATAFSKRCDCFNFFIFPHMYIRSPKVKPFSRSILPYSLHTKSFLITYKDGTGAVGLTSSNFATRDQVQENLLAVIEDGPNNVQTAKHFFNTLISNSISIHQFNEDDNFFYYRINKVSPPKPLGHTYYIAPFYNDSPLIIRDKIIELIKQAKTEIFFCAQHIASDHQSPETDIVAEALKATERQVSVNFLSQTFVDGSGCRHGQRQPVNKNNFKRLIQAVENTPHTSYYVNKTVHCKYLVIDDWVIITTCNMTPTEFIYKDKVSISKFDNIPGISYEGTFSEVGQFMIFKSKEVREQLVAHFKSTAHAQETYCHCQRS